MPTVFVSHASQDRAIVDRVVDDLRSAGHAVWIDHTDLGVGTSLAGSIQRGITESDAFLLLHSSSAAASPWVQLEWQAALSRHVGDPNYTFLLARLDDTEMPLLLQSRKWSDLGVSYTAGVREIVSALGTVEPAADDRPKVWYYDDEVRCTDAFKLRHDARFVIRTFYETGELLNALLHASSPGGGLPDLVLTDLYRPHDDVAPEDLAAAEATVKELFAAERALRRSVDAAWRPIGVEIVETVRDFYAPAQLPIVMHTQQGLVLLRDELIQQLEAMQVGWLLKGRFSAETDRLVLQRVMMSSRGAMPTQRPRVLVIDDNQTFIDDFVDRHQDHYEIHSLTSQAEVLPTLARLDARGTFPDLFLVDMYYPRGGDGSAELIAAANLELRAFAALEARVQTAIRDCFEAPGITVLREIRRHFTAAELPVVIYTQSGLLSIGDQGFREIERLGGGWLLKDRYDPRTEEVMICGAMFNSRKARPGSP